MPIHTNIPIPTKADVDYFNGLLLLFLFLFFYSMSFTHRRTLGKAAGHCLSDREVHDIQ